MIPLFTFILPIKISISRFDSYPGEFLLEIISPPNLNITTWPVHCNFFLLPIFFLKKSSQEPSVKSLRTPFPCSVLGAILRHFGDIRLEITALQVILNMRVEINSISQGGKKKASLTYFSRLKYLFGDGVIFKLTIGECNFLKKRIELW